MTSFSEDAGCYVCPYAYLLKFRCIITIPASCEDSYWIVMAKEGQLKLAHFCFSSVGRRLPAVDFELEFVAFLLGDNSFSEEVIIVVVKPDLLCDIDFLLCHGHCISLSHCRPPPLCGIFSCFWRFHTTAEMF